MREFVSCLLSGVRNTAVVLEYLGHAQLSGLFPAQMIYLLLVFGASPSRTWELSVLQAPNPSSTVPFCPEPPTSEKPQQKLSLWKQKPKVWCT